MNGVMPTIACVMNIITHDKAYSLYPRATFVHNQSVVLEPWSPAERALEKYSKRGWTQIGVKDATENTLDTAAVFPTGGRYVGDKSCWVLPLYPEINVAGKVDIESDSWTTILTQRAPGAASVYGNIIKIGNMQFARIVGIECNGYLENCLNLDVAAGNSLNVDEAIR